MEHYKHWTQEKDADNIIWLYLDRDKEPINSINLEVINELDLILDAIIKESPAGLIISSAKKKGFIAGADVKSFLDLTSEDQVFNLIRQGQQVFDKLEQLDIPTVAMINGFCLGGGFELALACRYRIALDDPQTKIGLPEIKLGIHPGWGGSIRLPKLIGAIPAMGIILPGAAISAKRAQKIGMIDAAVPQRQLKRTAHYYIINQPKPHEPALWHKYSNNKWLRSTIAKIIYKQLKKKKVQQDHYPAPYAMLENWLNYGVSDVAMINEAKSISKMAMTDTAKQLLRVFFLQNQLKESGKAVTTKPKHVHVIGAGTMGGDIAAWCALRGLHVTLSDRTDNDIAPAIKRAHRLFEKKLRKPYLVVQAMDRMQPDVKGQGIAKADIIIEAIFENLEAKQALFKTIETNAKPNAILATNTSSIPLESIATILTNPQRLVGIHFFNPVAQMPLVEVVKGKQTSEDVVASAMAFVAQIGKLPLQVTSCPGFLVNRVLMPYLMEAMILLEEGVPATTIDKAALSFGMPMGPIELADTVGLDVCLSVAQNLSQSYTIEIPQKLQTMVDSGELGVKSGKGFYQYKNRKKVIDTKEQTTAENTDITDRLIFSMLNEVAACLDENVVLSSDLLDAGMIFGTGFAPFRGGPVQYSRDRGVIDIVAQLEQFIEKYGPRFSPKKGWAKMKKTEALTAEV